MEGKRGPKFQQITMSVIYMHYLNTACHFGHHHNGCMVIGAFEHTRVHVKCMHVKFHVTGIQKSKEC